MDMTMNPTSHGVTVVVVAAAAVVVVVVFASRARASACVRERA